MDTLPTFETKQELNIMEKPDPLLNILEKQAKEFEEFGKRMSLELQSSLIKQQNGLTIPKVNSGVETKNTCYECREKTVLINSLKARIEELESDAKVNKKEIKKLQKDVKTLFDIIVKKGTTNFGSTDTMTTKITITNEIGEELSDVENTKPVNIEVEYEKEIDKNRLSVDSFQYNDDIKDSYSDSAIDLFTDDDDDDTSTTEDSVKGDNYVDSKYDNEYDRPSEWLDVSQTLRISRTKFDKKNLDRWNYKMATNGLLPIKLVGKVEADEEKKVKTHRKRYSTSAIWLKTYENNQKQKHDDKFKIPSFNFAKYSFKTTDDVKPKQKESKETYTPISLKSSVSTSVSELSTTSLATTSLQPYELLEHQKNTPISKENYSKSQQILSQYK